MNKIKAIVFDFGGVLLNLDMTKTEKAMSILLGREIKAPYPDEYKKLVLGIERGEMSIEQFIWSVQNLCPIVPQARDVIDAWNAMLLGWNPDRFALLAELKDKYDLYILSNTNAIHLDYVFRELKEQYDQPNFEDYFVQCFYSHEVGAWKPYADIYQKVEEQIPYSHEEFVFIDDNHDNVAGAQAVGWQAVHHETNSELRTTLANLNLL